uniref:Syndecan n=1 Tax=Phlebotomus papatasi TaxID=29031 RepID=A0A1B0DB40_PHLPP
MVQVMEMMILMWIWINMRRTDQNHTTPTQATMKTLIESEIDLHEIDHSHSTDRPHSSSESNNEVFIMNTKPEDRTASFFAQPGILAAVIGGAVVGLLCAILVVMFIVYRMRKKDEGSYALDEPKRSPAVNSYAKNSNNREFYA